MTDDEIMARLTDIFRKVFYDDAIVLFAETNASDISDWDSMTHITLIVEVEYQFGLKFKTAEIEELRDVGALTALVKARLPADVFP